VDAQFVVHDGRLVVAHPAGPDGVVDGVGVFADRRQNLLVGLRLGTGRELSLVQLGERSLRDDLANSTNAGDERLAVAFSVEIVRVNRRRGERARGVESDFAATLRTELCRPDGEGVIDGRVGEAVIEEVARAEVELQVGSRRRLVRANEAARLGDVRGERAAIEEKPLRDVAEPVGVFERVARVRLERRRREQVVLEVLPDAR